MIRFSFLMKNPDANNSDIMTEYIRVELIIVYIDKFIIDKTEYVTGESLLPVLFLDCRRNFTYIWNFDSRKLDVYSYNKTDIGIKIYIKLFEDRMQTQISKRLRDTHYKPISRGWKD